MVKKGKIIGLTASISFIMFIAIAFFIKALDALFGAWFNDNALIILIISLVIILIGAITGTISFVAMTQKGKSII